jgi:hypothetical protein
MIVVLSIEVERQSKLTGLGEGMWRIKEGTLSRIICVLLAWTTGQM